MVLEIYLFRCRHPWRVRLGLYVRIGGGRGHQHIFGEDFMCLGVTCTSLLSSLPDGTRYASPRLADEQVKPGIHVGGHITGGCVEAIWQ